MSLVGDAVYVEGHKVDGGAVEGTSAPAKGSVGPGSGGPERRFRWIGLLRPDEEELRRVAEEFHLHPLAVEDAVQAHQRPKMERYGETLFVVLRPAEYVDPVEVVEIGEVHLFLGPDFAIVVRHAEQPPLADVRHRLEENPTLLRRGPYAVLYGVLDRVVDDYGPVLEGLRNDIDEIETQVFGGEPKVSRRIYQLSREVIEFQRAVEPLGDVMAQLRRRLTGREDDTDVELLRLVRDVADHATAVRERVEAFRELLTNILTVNSTLVAQRQNEEITRLSEAGFQQNEQVKRISSMAAILFMPTLVAGVYGMNFRHVPELEWTYGYPLSLGLMALLMLGLYRMFKARGWL